MRERLRLLNGTLRAGPRDNEWAVTAELPLATVNGDHSANGGHASEDGITH
jgi:hypothetical protein